MSRMQWLSDASAPRRHANGTAAWLTFVMAGCLAACGPSDGKDNPAAGSAGTGGTGTIGASGSSGGATGGSGAVSDDPNFTLGEPQTLATGLPVPIRLVLMGEAVYFANRGLDDQATGAIMSVPKNGGPASAVASALPYVTGLAGKGGDSLIYTTYGLASASPREGSVVIHPLSGSPETAPSVQSPFEPSWADDALYFFSLNQLIRAPIGQTTSVLVTLTSPRRRWHDGGRIYITEAVYADYTTGRLRVWSESQPDAPVLNASLARPEGLVMADGRLYVACSGDGTVASIDPTSGAAQTVASGYVSPWGMAADAANVYFADRGALEACVAGDPHGAIVRLPLDGGPAQAIASGLPCPSAIAVDATGIYWVDNGTTPAASDGSVMKIAKIR